MGRRAVGGTVLALRGRARRDLGGCGVLDQGSKISSAKSQSFSERTHSDRAPPKKKKVYIRSIYCANVY